MKSITGSACGMSREMEEDKDIFKQGVNFIHLNEKAHEGGQTMCGIIAGSTLIMIHHFKKA